MNTRVVIREWSAGLTACCCHWARVTGRGRPGLIRSHRSPAPANNAATPLGWFHRAIYVNLLKSVQQSEHKPVPNQDITSWRTALRPATPVRPVWQPRYPGEEYQILIACGDFTLDQGMSGPAGPAVLLNSIADGSPINVGSMKAHQAAISSPDTFLFRQNYSAIA